MMKVCLFLDHDCNLRCTYCYNGRKFRRPMSMEVARAGVELALTGGRSDARDAQISFFGGEPLLHPDLMRAVVEHADGRAAERGMTVHYQVVTNGTLLTPSILDWLMEHRFYVGLSLDGGPAAQDATRRDMDHRSTYDRVADALQRLLRHPGNSGTRVIGVIDPANVDHLADSFDTLLGLGARHLSLNLNVEADWDDGARRRLEAAMDGLAERYVAAYRRGDAFTLNLLDGKIVAHIKGGYSCADRCDFGCQEIAVAPSGRLYPCDRLVGQDDRDDVVIGHVFHGVDTERRDALIASKNAVLADCADCAFQPRCMHWCGCVNYAMTGSVGGVDGLLCWFEQLRIETADRVAAVLYEERNPGFARRFYAPLLRSDR